MRDCSLIIKWLSNYIYLLEMFVRQIVNFFPPMKMQRPHVFAVRSIGRQGKKNEKVVKNAKLITFLCSMGIIPLHQCSFLAAAAAAVSSYLGGSGARGCTLLFDALNLCKRADLTENLCNQKMHQNIDSAYCRWMMQLKCKIFKFKAGNGKLANDCKFCFER